MRMPEKKNEVEPVPYRDPWCLHYDGCLDKAAKSDMEMTCTGCSRYRYQKSRFTDSDIRGVWALAIALFGN